MIHILSFLITYKKNFLIDYQYVFQCFDILASDQYKFKGTDIQIEKALINDRLRV